MQKITPSLFLQFCGSLRLLSQSSCPRPMYSNAHSHKHTRAHTHSHLTRAPPPHTHSLMVTPSHTFTRAHTCTHSHTGTHTHIGTHKLTQAHTCTHMLTHIHTCSDMHTLTHAHTHTYTHTHMLTQPHTCTYMLIYTRTHADTHLHTCTPSHMHTHAQSEWFYKHSCPWVFFPVRTLGVSQRLVSCSAFRAWPVEVSASSPEPGTSPLEQGARCRLGAPRRLHWWRRVLRTLVVLMPCDRTNLKPYLGLRIVLECSAINYLSEMWRNELVNNNN